jgi:hypothetical protein
MEVQTQPGTPFFSIITIPPLYGDMGMVVIGFALKVLERQAHGIVGGCLCGEGKGDPSEC